MPRRIHHIEVTNWKRARRVAFAPAVGVTQIVGPNESGKTSTLDAVIGTLAGARKRLNPADRVGMDRAPLTIGELRGGCVLDLGDIEVERVLTEANAAKGGVLHVRPKAGGKMGQRELDALFGDFSFDPLAIARMKPGELIGVLQRLSGTDWCETMERIDAELSQFESDRTAAGRRLRAMGNQPDPGPEPEPLEVTEATAAVTEAMKHNELQQARARAKERAGDECRRAEQALSFAQRRVAELEAELEGARMAAAENAETHQRALFAAQKLPSPDPLIELAPLQAKLAESGARTRARDAWQMASRRYQELRDASRSLATLEGKITELRDEKEKHARSAKLPIDGVTWSAGTVLVDGKPWEQESTSKLLRLCTKLAIALHPDLSVILIHQGEGLDQASFDQVCADAHAAGVDVLMEVVGEPHDGGDAVIEIRDGYAVNSEREW